jgi:uncharacterized protein (UPF0332 family)
VKTGLVPAEIGKVFARSFEKRQHSDYGDFAVIDPADAQDLSRAVRAFVPACGGLLQRLVAGR